MMKTEKNCRETDVERRPCRSRKLSVQILLHSFFLALLTFQFTKVRWEKGRKKRKEKERRIGNFAELAA